MRSYYEKEEEFGRLIGLGVNATPPEIPEILYLANRVKRYGLPWSGGVLDQPHILMREIEICELVIDEIELVKRKLAQTKLGDVS